jgi:hypothetical protein
MIILLITIIGTFLLGGYAIKKGQELEGNKKLIKNLEKYEEEKTKQQES